MSKIFLKGGDYPNDLQNKIAQPEFVAEQHKENTPVENNDFKDSKGVLSRFVKTVQNSQLLAEKQGFLFLSLSFFSSVFWLLFFYFFTKNVLSFLKKISMSLMSIAALALLSSKNHGINVWFSIFIITCNLFFGLSFKQIFLILSFTLLTEQNSLKEYKKPLVVLGVAGYMSLQLYKKFKGFQIVKNNINSDLAKRNFQKKVYNNLKNISASLALNIAFIFQAILNVFL